jgi:hypothetical protein
MPRISFTRSSDRRICGGCLENGRDHVFYGGRFESVDDRFCLTRLWGTTPFRAYTIPPASPPLPLPIFSPSPRSQPIPSPLHRPTTYPTEGLRLTSRRDGWMAGSQLLENGMFGTGNNASLKMFADAVTKHASRASPSRTAVRLIAIISGPPYESPTNTLSVPSWPPMALLRIPYIPSPPQRGFRIASSHETGLIVTGPGTEERMDIGSGRCAMFRCKTNVND